MLSLVLNRPIGDRRRNRSPQPSQRGQVTIPAEARRALGVRHGDKVVFTIADGEVRLAPAAFSLESAFGSVRPYSNPEGFDKVSLDAKEAKAEKTARELSTLA